MSGSLWFLTAMVPLMRSLCAIALEKPTYNPFEKESTKTLNSLTAAGYRLEHFAADSCLMPTSNQINWSLHHA